MTTADEPVVSDSDEAIDPMEAYLAGLLAGMLSRHEQVHSLEPLLDNAGIVTAFLSFGFGSASFVVEVRRTDANRMPKSDGSAL